MATPFQCDEFEALAVLYAAGELDEAASAEVEVHARECAACAAVLEREIQLRNALVEDEAAEGIDRSGLLLARCRSELSETLDEAEKGSARSGWRRFLSAAGWGAAFRGALAVHPGWSAAALLLAGVLVGLGGRAWYVETSLPLPGKPLMTVSAAPPISDQDLETMGVEAVRMQPQQDGEAPRVEVQMLATHPVVVQGSSDDAEIRRVLTYVIGHPQKFDPGVRLDSLDVLRMDLSDAQVRAALCQVARHDGNAAVRLKALEALHRSADDPDVVQAMLDALAGDDNSGVRIEAVNGLLLALDDAGNGFGNAPAGNAPAGTAPVNAPAVNALGANALAADAAGTASALGSKEKATLDTDALDVLRDRMQNDPNPYIRMRSAAALERLASMESRSANDESGTANDSQTAGHAHP